MVVQDLRIQSHNIRYRLELWDSPSQGRLRGELPPGVTAAGKPAGRGSENRVVSRARRKTVELRWLAEYGQEGEVPNIVNSGTLHGTRHDHQSIRSMFCPASFVVGA